jgi:hypothetical protein
MHGTLPCNANSTAFSSGRNGDAAKEDLVSEIPEGPALGKAGFLFIRQGRIEAGECGAEGAMTVWLAKYFASQAAASEQCPLNQNG